MKRLVIHPKDVVIITGKSERYARYLLNRIKVHLKKANHQVITIEEFCQYMGLNEDKVTKEIT